MTRAGTYSNDANFDLSPLGPRDVVIEGLAGSKFTYIDCLQAGQGIKLGNGAPENTTLEGRLHGHVCTANTNSICTGYL